MKQIKLYLNKLIHLYASNKLIGTFIVLISGLVISIWLAKPVFAQSVVSQIRDILVTKAGFTFLNNASSDFLYYKETENYTAYAGSKLAGSGHMLRLSVGKYILDYALLDASSVSLGSDISVASVSATSDAQVDPARQALARINALNEAIDSHQAEITTLLEEALNNSTAVAVDPPQLIDLPQQRIVVYQNIREGLDIKYYLNEGGIKEEMILHNPDKLYHVFVYSYDAHGLTSKNMGGGVWYFYNSNNTPIFRIPKGWAKDAAGAFTNDVDVVVDQGIIRVKVNEQWLYSNDRVFPIVVDPSIEVIPEKRLSRGAGVGNDDVAGDSTVSAIVPQVTTKVLPIQVGSISATIHLGDVVTVASSDGAFVPPATQSAEATSGARLQ